MAETSWYEDMPGSDAVTFADLLLALHRSVEAELPWRDFLQALCGALDACSATLVLRHPTRGDRGELFDVNTVMPLVEIYRSRRFEDDPFEGLVAGEVSALADRVDRATLHASAYHRELLAPDAIADMLALNVAIGDSYTGSFRIARRTGSRPFAILEKSLMARLYPHLGCALASFERSRRCRIENRAYIGTLDQLSLGVIILNDRGDMVRSNGPASRLVAGGSLSIVAGKVRAAVPEEDKALAAAIDATLTGEGSGDRRRGWLALTGPDDGTRVHLLLKPIDGDGGGDDRQRPLGVAIYVTGAERATNVTPTACAALFGLSPAEATLLVELLGGASILSASTMLGISESTARTQLRSMFAKTGTHRQADLVRLVLTSLATIA